MLPKAEDDAPAVVAPPVKQPVAAAPVKKKKPVPPVVIDFGGSGSGGGGWSGLMSGRGLLFDSSLALFMSLTTAPFAVAQDATTACSGQTGSVGRGLTLFASSAEYISLKTSLPSADILIPADLTPAVPISATLVK